MKKLLYGWKVITYHRWSAIRTSSGLEYEKGKRAHRSKRRGPLAVFTSKKYAEKFANFYSSGRFQLQVVTCKYKPSRDKMFWTEYSVHEFSSPPGTDFADFVTCLE